MMKIMLSYSGITAAEKGPNIGNIIYGHKKFFPAKNHSYGARGPHGSHTVVVAPNRHGSRDMQHRPTPRAAFLKYIIY